jgi:long-chain acyl-CoA synthetase
MHSLN